MQIGFISKSNVQIVANHIFDSVWCNWAIFERKKEEKLNRRPVGKRK